VHSLRNLCRTVPIQAVKPEPLEVLKAKLGNVCSPMIPALMPVPKTLALSSKGSVVTRVFLYLW
jgi:hypothetical protein